MLASKSFPGWIDAVWLACLALYILAGTDIAPFHGDESTLMFMGRDFHALFVDRELAEALYDETRSEGHDEQRLRLMNGSVSKTVYGWLAWQNGIGADDLNGQWRWLRGYDFNRAAGNLPDEQALGAARLASAAQLALALGLLFLFARSTLNRPSAYLASAMFTLHPNVLINGRRAMMEGSHLLGLMLVLLAGVWLLQERRWWSYALLGVCMGFAVAAKHPNAIICLIVFATLFGLLQRRQWREQSWNWAAQGRLSLAFAATLIVALLTFLLLNPPWWSAPLELPQAIASMRANLLASQVEVFGGYNSFWERILGFFRFVFAAEHQYFEVARWADYAVITAQIETYAASGLAGIQLGASNLTGALCLLLALFGGAQLARASAIAGEKRLLLLVWFIASALATLLLTPLPWARYYLPLAPAVILLVSYAFVVLASALWQRIYSKANGVTILA